jgi:hypothetical protein
MAFARKSLTAPKGANAAKAETNAHYIIGIAAANKKEHSTAAKELRAALPGLKGTPSMEGPALYFLGESVYAIGRQQMDRTGADQGIKYMLQAALIGGGGGRSEADEDGDGGEVGLSPGMRQDALRRAIVERTR